MTVKEQNELFDCIRIGSFAAHLLNSIFLGKLPNFLLLLREKIVRKKQKEDSRTLYVAYFGSVLPESIIRLNT